MPNRFLIVSASMGAGHDGAARELKHRLEADGHRAEIVDYLEMAPFRLMHAVRWTYEAQLRFAPWTYQVTYKLWMFLPFLYSPLVGFNSLLARRRIKRAIDRVQPDVVVSTYCLATLVLGRMRRKRWLRVPAVTFLTDFAVHPLCVHPGVDLTLAVSPQTAADALEQKAAAVGAPGPLVPAKFIDAQADRAAVRTRFGIPDGKVAALVVAGSWGVGEVVDTVEELAAIDGVHPVTVCGRDEDLRAALDERGIGTVVGWTTEMAALMGASDVVVENAGGLTCMEAFRVGVPVVTYRPIPGHGLDNAAHMHRAGVNRYVHSSEELAATLRELGSATAPRTDQVARATALFAGNAAADVAGLATKRDRVVVPFRKPRGRRVVKAAAAAVIISYGALTVGAQAATARGVGVAHAPKGSTRTAFVGVRLTDAEANDVRVVNALKTLQATAVVDARTAERTGASLADLNAQGVNIANGGWGKGDRYRWNRARSDLGRAGARVSAPMGSRAELFVPGRRIDGFDLVMSRRNHQRIVRADRTIHNVREAGEVRGGKIYLVDGRDVSADELVAMLAELQSAIAGASLSSAPLSSLA